MQLLVITREDFFSEEAAALNDLFEAGLTGLHLRKPGATDHEVRALLRAIRTDFHSRILVHNHQALSGEFDILGVHLPLNTLLQADKIRDKGQISCSAHSLAEIQAAATVADRAFISPLFNSLSKKDYRGNASLCTVPKPKGNTLWVALGGITPNRLAAVHRYGFEAAAVMGYIWQGGQPRQQFAKCQAAAAGLTKETNHETH